MAGKAVRLGGMIAVSVDGGNPQALPAGVIPGVRQQPLARLVKLRGDVAIPGESGRLRIDVGVAPERGRADYIWLILRGLREVLGHSVWSHDPLPLNDGVQVAGRIQEAACPHVVGAHGVVANVLEGIHGILAIDRRKAEGAVLGMKGVWRKLAGLTIERDGRLSGINMLRTWASKSLQMEILKKAGRETSTNETRISLQS